jgi:hypothetical protein
MNETIIQYQYWLTRITSVMPWYEVVPSPVDDALDVMTHLPVPHVHASFGVQSLPSNTYSPSINDLIDASPLQWLLQHKQHR